MFKIEKIYQLQNLGITFYFHKVVVLSIVTGDGPIPMDFRFVMPSEISHLAPGISEEKLKAECELTASKTLLRDLAKRFGGKLPFDILTADALFANAPFMEMIEALERILKRFALARSTGQSSQHNSDHCHVN